MLYAAQYRDMDSAKHHLSIHKTCRDAKRFIAHIYENETMAPLYMQSDIDIEIDFRNVPSEYRGETLLLINLDLEPIPDCYWTHGRVLSKITSSSRDLDVR